MYTVSCNRDLQWTPVGLNRQRRHVTSLHDQEPRSLHQIHFIHLDTQWITGCCHLMGTGKKLQLRTKIDI